MEFKIFGKSGKPCLVFPSMMGAFYEFEDCGMVKAVEEYIENGKLCLICIQSNDLDSWCLNNDEQTRILNHEQWFNYVCQELVPFVHSYLNTSVKLMSMGVSMGAFHAVNIALRHPELFDCVIGMSGIYRASIFLPNYKDQLVYFNSPIDYLSHLQADHPFAQAIKQLKVILCVGQGAFEEDCILDTKAMEKLLERFNIEHFVDYWGYDVNHDWYWWQKQLPYLLERCI